MTSGEDLQEKGRRYVMDLKKLFERPSVRGSVVLNVYEAYTGGHRCLCQDKTFDMSIDEEKTEGPTQEDVVVHYASCANHAEPSTVKGRFKEFVRNIFEVIKDEFKIHKGNIHFVFISTYSPMPKLGEKELSSPKQVSNILKDLGIVEEVDDAVMEHAFLMAGRVHVIVIPPNFLHKLMGG